MADFKSDGITHPRRPLLGRLWPLFPVFSEPIMTVTPELVDRLLQDLEGLRGCVLGRGARQADRIDDMMARARALQAAAQGSAHELLGFSAYEPGRPAF